MLAVMLVLGTPFAGPLAAILLVGGLIPYLGALVATLAIVLVALGGQGLGPALIMLAAAVAIEVALTLGRSPGRLARPPRPSGHRAPRASDRRGAAG